MLWSVLRQNHTDVLHLLTVEHPLIPVVPIFSLQLLSLLIFSLPRLQEGLPFLFESFFVELKVLPDKLSSEGVVFGIGFELLSFDQVAFGQNLVYGVLPVLLVEPFVFGYFVVVELFVEDVLLALSLVPLNESVLMLDGSGTFC